MVAKKIETAEQKLLKMIEASSGGGGAVSESQKKFSQQQSLLKIVRTAKKFLVLGVLAALLVLGYEIKTGFEVLGKTVQIADDGTIKRGGYDARGLIPTIQRVSFYLAKINERNIFQPYAEAQVKNVVDVSESNRKIAEKTEHLRLVGISWMDTVASASVMLEDVKTKETAFLRKGDKIGDITVKTIYANSVELGYENEEIIIRYDKPKE